MEPKRTYLTMYLAALPHRLHQPRHIGSLIRKFLFRCPVCGYTARHKSATQRHHMMYTGERLFKYDYCSRAFNQLAAILHHGPPVHPGPERKMRVFKCQVCDYSAIRKRDVHRHEMVHTGERPHKCDYCSRAFSQRCNLVSHIHTHTGERPYQCHLCPWNSAWKKELMRHLEVHKHRKHAPEDAHT
ncbi:zinc finger Y-chromosomal protein-like isoform X1 [Rhipicephalus microplus]|uniref:zinc finger Y-chromosomal protein-like isoform X1 n=1 Tax=Rhipicephalus microplus TaxID=6941 RepID=UPI003F6C4F82